MSNVLRRKFGLSRTVGLNILGRVKNPVNTRNYGPGVHGKDKKKRSEYWYQLKEVQKIKQFYGKLRQKDIERIAEEARESKERNYDSLVKILESRLATFVYRAKWAATIFGARQLVNHGHIKVNDHKVDIWSYRLKVGDKVSLCDYMRDNAHVVAAQNLNERTIPEYVKPESNFVFSLEFLPNLAGTYFPCKMNFSLALDLLLKF